MESSELALEALEYKVIREEKWRAEVESFDNNKARELSDQDLNGIKFMRSALAAVQAPEREHLIVNWLQAVLKIPDAERAALLVIKALGPRVSLASLPILAAYSSNMSEAEFSDFYDFFEFTVVRAGLACKGEYEMRNRLGALDDVLIKNNNSWSKWWYLVYGWSNNIGYVGSYPGDSAAYLKTIATDWFGKSELVKKASFGKEDWRMVARMYGGRGFTEPLPDDPAEAYNAVFKYWNKTFCDCVFQKTIDGDALSDWALNIDNYASGGATKILGVKSTDQSGVPVITRKVKAQIPGVLSAAELSGIVRNSTSAPQQSIFIKPNEVAKFRGVISGDDTLFLQMSYVGNVLERSIDHKSTTPRPTSTFDKPAEFIISMEEFNALPGVPMPLDQSKFDRHVTMQEQLSAFGACIDRAEELCRQPDSKAAVRAVGNVILERLPKTEINIPGGAKVSQESGLSSGIKWTSLGNSIVNFSQVMTSACVAASLIGYNPIVAIRVQGDDCRLKFVNSYAGAVFYFCLEGTGVSVNAAKFFYNGEADFYLRKLVVNIDNAWVFVGPPARTARGLVWIDPGGSDEIGEGFLPDAASNWWLLVQRSVATIWAATGAKRQGKLPPSALVDMSGIASRLILSGGDVSFLVNRWLLTPRACSRGSGGGFKTSQLGWEADAEGQNVAYIAPRRVFTGNVFWRPGSVMGLWFNRFTMDMKRTLRDSYMSRLSTKGTYEMEPGSLSVTEDAAGAGMSLLAADAVEGTSWIASTNWYEGRVAVLGFGDRVRREMRRPKDDFAYLWSSKHVRGWSELGESARTFAASIAVDSVDFKREWSHFAFRGMSESAYSVLVEKEYPQPRIDLLNDYQSSIVTSAVAVIVVGNARKRLISRGWNVNAALAIRGAIPLASEEVCRKLVALKKNVIYVG